MAKRNFSNFAASSDQDEQSKHLKRIPEENFTQKSQQSLLSNFFGQTKPKVRGAGPIYETFPLNFSIYSWNINGASSQLQKGTLANFLKDHDPLILCLNETKIDEEKLDSKKTLASLPSSYAQYWNCCKSKKGYSGTAIFTKVRPSNVVFDFAGHDQEGRSITMEFELFFLVAVYVPNAGEGLKRLQYRVNEWDADFQDYLLSLNKPVILTGDLNVAHQDIDIYDPKGKHKVAGFTPEERNSFSQFLEKSKWIDTFRFNYPEKKQFTFWSARGGNRVTNLGWRLDYFLISPELMQDCASDTIIHDQVLGSDHCPIELLVTLPSVMRSVIPLKANLKEVKQVVAVELSDELSRGLQLEDSTPMKMVHEKRKSNTPLKLLKTRESKTPAKSKMTNKRSKSAVKESDNEELDKN